MKKKYVAFVIIIMSVAVIFNLITTQEFFKEKFNIHFDKKGSTNNFIDLESNDGYYYSQYFKINSSSWNELKLDNSGFIDIEEFLIYMDNLVNKIEDFSFLDGLDYSEKVKIDFRDFVYNSASMIPSKNNTIIIEKDLFENNTYCFEKDIYSLFTIDGFDGLDLGYGYYMNYDFTNNVAYPNYGVDIDVFVANKIINHNGYELSSYENMIKLPTDINSESVENYIAINYSFVKFLIDDYGLEDMQLLLKADNRVRAFYEIYGKKDFELMAMFIEKLKSAKNYIEICEGLMGNLSLEDYENIGLKEFSIRYNGDYKNREMYILNFSFNAFIFEGYGFRKFSALEKYNYDYYLIYDKTLEDLKNDWKLKIENYNMIKK